MITTKQEKDKTTIVVPRKLNKAELKYVLNYLSSADEKPVGKISKQKIRETSEKITKNAWEKLKKKRGFAWSQ